MSRQLGAVYNALVAEVEQAGGSVIGFAGDAMLCWFDAGILGQETGLRASSAALGMQQAMRSFPGLGLKAAITSGAARRFVVGDPQIQLLDVLAGATVARTSTAEHLAASGEVLLDEATANALQDSLKISEWRSDVESGAKFALLASLSQASDFQPLPADTPPPPPEALKQWVHPAVFARETTGQGPFLTEFRPCVALFVRFIGIDYDADQAASELDAFIRQVQKTAGRFGGALMDITIGDKGSYAYLSFGALRSHEDDPRRAVKTALELIQASSLRLQIGVTQGPLRVGAYGAETRKAFGALGDDVNLAARLMTIATPGEILVSGHVHKATHNSFTFEPRAPLPVKGKAEPLPVFALTGERRQRAVRLQEPVYALPMVGRTRELQTINDRLDLAANRNGQVIAIVAEAGLGKSRLVAEVIRSARRKGFVGYGGACQSDGIHTPYLAWKPIWQAFFDVDPDMPARKLFRWLESEIEDLAPQRVEAMPLLGPLLDLNIPENDFTRSLEPQIRQNALHALLEDCWKAATQDAPLLVVIEDLHWIDALSHDLLEQLVKTLAKHAACFVLAYRPPQIQRLQAPRLEALPQFTRVELHELTRSEAESAIRAKLAQLYPARSAALPAGLVDALMARSQGNPFYLEELLNYVRDRGLDPAALQSIELPDSLHTLILSRIDQLDEQEKTTLRLASIIGRLFRLRWLTGYYPELGPFPQVKAALDKLAALDITPLDAPEPELAYLFKHILTHEVTYESLPFAARARLHEQLGHYLESAAVPVDTIAFHYSRSHNLAKQREYLRKAGEAAQKNFANDAALEYFGRLLPLLDDPGAHFDILLKRGQVLALMGRYAEAESDDRRALELGEQDGLFKARALFALGNLGRLRGDFAASLDWLKQAQAAYRVLEDAPGLALALIETGFILLLKAEIEPAREMSHQGLALARQAGDKLATAQALNNLGILARKQNDFVTAQALLEESLALRREVGDKLGIANSLNNLGNLASHQGHYPSAQALYAESLALKREMGDKSGIANTLQALGQVAHLQGDYPAARRLLEESLATMRELGHMWRISNLLVWLGTVAAAQGDYLAARELNNESLALARQIGNKPIVAYAIMNLGNIAYAQGDYPAARLALNESLALSKDIQDKSSLAYALLSLGQLELAERNPAARQPILDCLHLARQLSEKPLQTSSLIGAAGLASFQGDTQLAAQLLGAVESALKALNAVIEPDLKEFHVQTQAAVWQAMGEPACQSAWQQGSLWSLDDALAIAVEQLSRPPL